MFPRKNKKCTMQFKGVPPSDLLTYEEVKNLDEYAGILADDIILVDVDDLEQSDKLMNVIEDLQLNCRVYQTSRGRHFLFKNDKVDKCGTKVKLAIGLTADIKIGSRNSYEVLMSIEEMAYTIMCPYETDPDICNEYDCIKCTKEWLETEVEK